MNDEDKIDVTVQWYKANVVRLVFNGRLIWETKDIALDDVIDSHKMISETTLRLGLLEATNYAQILYRGLQIGRLEQINLLVQLRMKQWQMKVALFEMNLKQRLADMGLAKLLGDIVPSDPDSCTGNGEPYKYSDKEDAEFYDGYEYDTAQRCDCGECAGDGMCDEVLSGRSKCDGGCDDCDGAYCDKIDIDDIESNDDTLHLCKGCSGERESCAGCPDADPNDRYMNDADGESDYNAERDANNRRAGENSTGLASDDDILQR